MDHWVGLDNLELYWALYNRLQSGDQGRKGEKDCPQHILAGLIKPIIKIDIKELTVCVFLTVL